MSYTITRRATDNIDSNTESNEHVAGRLKRGNSNKNVSPTVSPTTKNVGWNDVHGIAKKEYLIPQFITVDNNGSQNILYVPVRARAGYLLGYGDPEYLSDLTSFSLPGLSGGTYRSFEVEGNSMEPTLKNKELIIGEWVESLEHIRDDRVHIVVTKTDGIVIKRLLNRISEYGYVVAKSDAVDNRADYPNLNIYPEDILEVWYAVWHGGFDFKGPAEMYKRVNNLEADITEVMRLLKEAGLKQ